MSVGFSSPQWLYLPFLVGVTGLALLRRRHRRERLFPTLEFFSPEISGSPSRRAGIDWLGALLLFGAFLMAIAPASPGIQFRSTGAPAWPVHAIARCLPGGAVAELFVQSNNVPHQHHLTLTLQEAGHVMTFPIAGRRLAGGVTLSGIPVAQSFSISLARSARILWRTTLTRAPAPPPTNVNLIGHPPEALLRLMKIMPGVRWNRPGRRATIWLVESSRFRPATIPPSRHTIVLAIGRTNAPALRVGTIVRPPRRAKMIGAAASRRSGVLRRVSWRSVRVARMFAAQLGDGWRILARMGGLPWLARRVSPRTHIQWFWLASPPRDFFTDWQHHASFVVFFVNVLRRTTEPLRNMAADGWWRPAAPFTAARRTHSRLPVIHSYPLSMGLALLASLLLLVAAMGFVNRYPRLAVDLRHGAFPVPPAAGRKSH